MQTPVRKNRGFNHNTETQGKCVCQICTCGDHKCPQPGTPNRIFQGETTQQHDYKSYGLNQQKRAVSPLSRNYEPKHYNPQILNTTYKNAYSPPKIESYAHNSQNKPKWNDYKASKKDKFQDNTEYKDSFKQDKQIAPEFNQKLGSNRNKYTPNPAKFEGTSTYTTQFNPKKASLLNTGSFKPTYGTPIKQNAPFDDHTTYKNDYPLYKNQTKPRTKTQLGDKNNFKPNNTKFEGQSHYKTNYKPYETQDNKICPVKKLPKIPRQCSPGKKHLHYSPQKKQWT